MPPLRRARPHLLALTPYTGGRGRRISRAQSDDDDDAGLTALPDDVLFEILPRVFSDADDVARFAIASTCPGWSSFVATHAATMCRVLPPTRFLPTLALGCFQQENDAGRCAWGRKRLAASSSPQPRFFPAAAASSSRTFFLGPLAADGDPMFDYAQPVASRNGRVVFELRRDARGDGLTLVVSNPMTGDTAVLPSLTGSDCPGYYTCAILTGDDLDTPSRSTTDHHSFFRLLIIYNRPGFTAMRCYSSDAGSWGPERRKPGRKILDHRLRRLGHAVVVGGVAYWPFHWEAFGVRLSNSNMDVCSVPYTYGGYWPDLRILGVSPDGRELRYIDVGFRGRSLVFSSLKTQFDDHGGQHDVHVKVPDLRPARTTPIKLRWFGEKSGTVIFTTGDADGGVFAVNMAEGAVGRLADGTAEKLADGGGYNACRNIYGYEMDRASVFASLAD